MSMMQQFVAFSVNPHRAQCNNLHVPQYITYTSQRSKHGGISSSQGDSSRDMADAAAAAVAKAEAEEGDVEDVDTPHMVQAMFLHNLFPNLEGHSRYSCLGQIPVEFPLCLPVNMPSQKRTT
jgi:hypothetical protein